MEVFTIRGLDVVSAEVRAAELRLEGYQADLVPVRKRSGAYNVVYWRTQKSIDVSCEVPVSDAHIVQLYRALNSPPRS